jgi:anaerobic dimethyl sulfoxide reductase subunit B (iron-sulfur subunit)
MAAKMTYAFTFDASACSGCKACQVACKDKNNLPVGVLWRRVYEVSGGGWYSVGAGLSRPELTDAKTRARGPRPYGPNAVWENTIFAYNLSIACNHCVHPKCAGVCPAEAYVVREDGIVYIDESKCMGCGYCNWACPYAVPQYNSEFGHMTKCNFCMDNIDLGLPPACVAACPMRVLDIQSTDNEPQTTGGLDLLWKTPSLQHPFPMPAYSHTEPHLAIQPHAGMLNSLEKTVANQEEVKPKKGKSELSLVAFTLLAQMAAGIAVFSLFSGPLSSQVLITLGMLLGIAGIISLLHLGRPLNAWRSLTHLKKSWLSREILMFGLFGLSWFFCWFVPGMGKLPLGLFGMGLVYSMAQVYRLRSIPAWDSNRTLLNFAVSAVVIGGLALEFFDPSMIRLLFVEAGLGAAMWLSLSERDEVHETARRLRLGLIGVSMVGVVIMSLTPTEVGMWMLVPIFLMALSEEIVGRWLFYEHLGHRPL